MAEGGARNHMSWEELATSMQQRYLDLFGEYDWDSYRRSEREYLEKKVGFGLYGPPEELPFTIVERISSTILKGDMTEFLLYLPEEDWGALRSSTLEYLETLITSTLFTSPVQMSNYEKLKEYDVIQVIRNSITEGDQKTFAKYFIDTDWDTFNKSINDFVEELVATTLVGNSANQSSYNKKQNLIVDRVCAALLKGDPVLFSKYLPKKAWVTNETAAIELLKPKIGYSLFGTRLFSYSEVETKKIDGVCEVVLSGDKRNFLNFLTENDWRSYQQCLRELYTKNVKESLFGAPGKLSLEKDLNQSGYTAKQYECIKKVCSAIIREDRHRSVQQETYMSIIYLCLEVPRKDEMSDIHPTAIFKVPSGSEGSVRFIDSSGRVYQNWADFLENNELPQCKYCYPRDGVYQTDDEGTVLVDFGQTPACKISKRALGVLDTANTGLVLGSTVLSLASLLVPVAGPLMAASVIGGVTAGAYGAARSSAALVDRAQHSQSIGLEDSDARNCWLSIAGSVVGTASLGATSTLTRMTQAGQVVGSAGRITTTVLNFSSLAVNGLGVVHGAFLLHNKYQDGALTPLDIFQFSASVLFFTHSAVNLKTADTIIRETQTDVLQKYQDNLRSNRHRKAYRKVTRNTQKDMNAVEGRAKVIRSLRKIESKDDFFAGLVRSDKDFRKTRSTVKLTEEGLVEINGKLTTDPMKFAQISRDQRQIILNTTKNLASGTISHQEFVNTTQSIVTQLNVPMNLEMNDCECSFNEFVNSGHFQGISSEGQFVLNLVSLHEMLMIYKILTNVDKPLHLRALQLAAKLSESIGWSSEKYFVRVLDFVVKSVYNVASRMEERYQEDLEAARHDYGPEFDEEAFNINYKISGQRFNHFCSVVLEEFFNPVVLDALKSAYRLGQEYYEKHTAEINNEIVENVSNSEQDNVSEPGEIGAAENAYDLQSENDSSEFGRSDENHISGLQEDDVSLRYTEGRPLLKSRVFWLNDDVNLLKQEEIFDIVQEVTGLLVDHTNCFIEYEGIDINASIIVPHDRAVNVLIICNFDEGTITAFSKFLS